MKHSLRFKITFVLMLSMFMLILLCWGINRFFLADYYQHTKEKMLGESFFEIEKMFSAEDAFVNSSLTDAQIEEINSICANRNLSVYIITRDKIYATNSSRIAKERMDYSRFSYTLGTLPSYQITNIQYLSGGRNYDIFFQTDLKQQANFIDLYGILDNKVEIFIRTTYESIQESAKIASRFLFYVGSAVILLGSLLMYGISCRFTKPILEMADISKKMSQLDFDAKYDVRTKDEIAVLGNSINDLSEKLEHTISELKGANLQLESDIQDKIQIDEMRKEFLSNVTHELKTPIALIQGYAEGLQDNINEDSESREFYCDVIIDEAQKMNKMVKKLLTLNQLEFGTDQIHMERFDLTQVITSVLNSVEILLKQKEIRVIFEEKSPSYIWADEYMVEEVITNYISNAINHVSGRRVIEIKLVSRGDTVRLAVFNTGEKIPEEDLEKVWVKFYKVDKARTREYGGSGIGLSIVKAIMSAHHKECGVINHEQGVEFWAEFDTGKNDTELLGRNVTTGMTETGLTE